MTGPSHTSASGVQGSRPRKNTSSPTGLNSIAGSVNITKSTGRPSPAGTWVAKYTVMSGM